MLEQTASSCTSSKPEGRVKDLPSPVAAQGELVTVPESSGYQGMFFPSTIPETPKEAESPAAHGGAGSVGWQRMKAAHPEVQ